MTLAISVLGVVVIYSANHGRPELFFRNLYIRQIYWILYGLVVMLITLLVDYRKFRRYAYLIYGLPILALMYVLFFGTVTSGSRRWTRTTTPYA